MTASRFEHRPARQLVEVPGGAEDTALSGRRGPAADLRPMIAEAEDDGAPRPRLRDDLGAFVVGPDQIAIGTPGGPLSGLRFACKDLFDVAGSRTGAGNPDWLADAPVATRHAVAVEALLAAGADLWGKTVTDELAFSLAGTNVHYGTPRNPIAPDRVPGGSSSGSAVAVAGGAVDLALGTDTGGSIRVPASYCGICGIRPTHGRIDQQGVFLLAPSFCTVGLFAPDGQTLRQGWAALAAGATAPGWQAPAARRVEELVVVPELMAVADDDAASSLYAAVHELAIVLGLTVRERVLPDGWTPERILEAFRTIQFFEAWQLHGDWITSRHPTLGPGVQARFRTGASVSQQQVAEARAAKRAWDEALGDLMGDGLLALPAASGPAPRLNLEGSEKDDLRRRTLILTAPAGLAGAPAVSLPLGAAEGLPVGLSLVGRRGDDDLLVRLAAITLPA
ncbi:MAG: amidase [Acidimicrobiaceae bacterium]|nr:amidase [Acidimicrobiaceae bacterium]